MAEFWRELLIGLAAMALGIWATLNNQQVIFTGLIVFGLISVIVSFVHLAQSKNKTDSAGNTVRNIFPTDNPREKALFLQTLDTQEDLAAPKEGSDLHIEVYLNGEQVGLLTPDSPVNFFVTKRNNVVNISEEYEGICFFHVSDAEGIGLLNVGMGISSPAVKIESNTGLEKGIIETRKPDPESDDSDGAAGEGSGEGQEDAAETNESDPSNGGDAED